ncbi:MAG: LLM class flavin-dependent oxidoreductase [Hymenobacter sp.]
MLDQSPVRPGTTARQALLETTELAQLADRLGYTRYWVSEHHNTTTLAGPTPEVLLAHLGAHTRHIRLGSGGVMLPHYCGPEGGRKLQNARGAAPRPHRPGHRPRARGRPPHGLRPQPRQSVSGSRILSSSWLTCKRTCATTARPKPSTSGCRPFPRLTRQPELWLLSSSGQSGLFRGAAGHGASRSRSLSIRNGGPAAVRQYRAAVPALARAEPRRWPTWPCSCSAPTPTRASGRP